MRLKDSMGASNVGWPVTGIVLAAAAGRSAVFQRQAMI